MLRAILSLGAVSIIVLACTTTSSTTPAVDAATTATSPTPSATTAASAATPASGRATDTFQTSKGPLVVTPIQHASTLLAFGGKNIYIDPVSDGDYTGLPKADFIFISDIHKDHLDPKKIADLKQAGTVIVGPQAVAREAADLGIVVLDNGASKSFGDFSVEAIPMYNLTRGPAAGKLFHDKGRGDGYVFTFGDKRVYFSGDTECTPEMKALKNIDVAFVCMNLPYTMPPSEAAECVRAFQPKVLIPYHFRGSNLDELKTALKDTPGVEVRIRKWYP